MSFQVLQIPLWLQVVLGPVHKMVFISPRFTRMEPSGMDFLLSPMSLGLLLRSWQIRIGKMLWMWNIQLL
jgi:hypothetical protein